jgi:zinc transporter 2
MQKTYDGALKKLCCVSWVSIFFIAAQLTGGILAGSIAIMCDTAHLATDMIGFVIAIIALKLSLIKADKRFTYGWQRAEVIGTIISIVFLITITLWLVKEAVDRVVNPTHINADVMLFTAAAGLFFNLVQMAILHGGDDHFHLGGETGHDHDHDHGHSHGEEGGSNLNIDAAYLHALSDMINSIGVCIAASIIYFFPKAEIADPICAFIFAILVVIQVIPIMSSCIHVLMEGAPDVD